MVVVVQGTGIRWAETAVRALVRVEERSVAPKLPAGACDVEGLHPQTRQAITWVQVVICRKCWVMEAGGGCECWVNLVPTWSTATDRAGGVAWRLHHNIGARVGRSIL